MGKTAVASLTSSATLRVLSDHGAGRCSDPRRAGDPRGGALQLLNGQMLAAPKALHVNG